jgi:hypothetical protein
MQKTEKNTLTSSLKKGIYLFVGAISLAAGVIGIFLPVLPTTPFILLSAWCFFRSSSKIYEWVISNERFGPTIENYQQGRGITKSTKIKAVVMMWLTISASVYFYIKNMYLMAFLYIIAISVTVYLYKLPTLQSKVS